MRRSTVLCPPQLVVFPVKGFRGQASDKRSDRAGQEKIGQTAGWHDMKPKPRESKKNVFFLVFVKTNYFFKWLFFHRHKICRPLIDTKVVLNKILVLRPCLLKKVFFTYLGWYYFKFLIMWNLNYTKTCWYHTLAR